MRSRSRRRPWTKEPFVLPGGAACLSLLLLAADVRGQTCAPAIYGSESSFSFINELAGTTDDYASPKKNHPTTAGTKAFLDGVRARMPLFEPKKDPMTNDDLVVVSGWYYFSFDPSKPNEGQHMAIDYWPRSVTPGVDPTFPVHAVAGGVVLTVTFDIGFGNRDRRAHGARRHAVPVALRPLAQWSGE